MSIYVTVAEVRAHDVPTTFSDELIQARLDKWEKIVENLTGNLFSQTSPGALTFDGNNHRILHFSIPLITVTSLTINSEIAALDTAQYRVYNGIVRPQDHRSNPKIELTGDRSGSSFSIFSRTPRIWIKGANQTITGTWGYVDPDPVTPGLFVTPIPVKDAIIQLVIRDLVGYFDHYHLGATPPSLASIKRERTDGHEIEYAVEDMAGASSGSMSWSMIPASIRDVLLMYRSPLRIATPEPIKFLPQVQIHGY